jgi:hypothetical protein
MRKIAFRAWDKKNKEMVYDFWIGSREAMIRNVEQQDIEGHSVTLGEPIKDYELMQFTGLLDRNGIKIYEGEILEHPDYCNMALEGNLTSAVEWGQTGDSDGYVHGIHFEWVVGGNTLADVYQESKVIGNIYENQELLEGERNK